MSESLASQLQNFIKELFGPQLRSKKRLLSLTKTFPKSIMSGTNVAEEKPDYHELFMPLIQLKEWRRWAACTEVAITLLALKA